MIKKVWRPQSAADFFTTWTRKSFKQKKMGAKTLSMLTIEAWLTELAHTIVPVFRRMKQQDHKFEASEGNSKTLSHTNKHVQAR